MLKRIWEAWKRVIPSLQWHWDGCKRGFGNACYSIQSWKAQNLFVSQLDKHLPKRFGPRKEFLVGKTFGMRTPKC